MRRGHGAPHASVATERGLNYLKSKLAPLIEEQEGLAADCAGWIREHAERNPDAVDRTLALIGRAGALFPFLRSSALLRYLDGQNRRHAGGAALPGRAARPHGPVVMGVLEPDNDYRPRIYP